MLLLTQTDGWYEEPSHNYFRFQTNGSSNATARAAPSTCVPPRLLGLDSFVINMRVRARTDIAAADKSYTTVMKKLNESLVTPTKAVRDQLVIRAKQVAALEAVRSRIGLEEIRAQKQQADLVMHAARLPSLQAKYNASDEHWNQSIANLVSQLDAAQESAVMTGSILKQVRGPEKLSSISKTLTKRRRNMANNRVNA